LTVAGGAHAAFYPLQLSGSAMAGRRVFSHRQPRKISGPLLIMLVLIAAVGSGAVGYAAAVMVNATGAAESDSSE